MVALRDIAAGQFQAHDLAAGFHAFGDDLQPHALGEDDGGRDDRAVTVAVAQGCDQATVQLQLGDRQCLQVGKTGIATAEVVQADADPGRLEHCQLPKGDALAIDDRRFGDLQLDPAGLQAALLQHFENLVAEAGLVQLQRRNVDTHAHRRALAARLRQLPADELQHLHAQTHNEDTAIGYPDKTNRVEEPQLRMLPSRQVLIVDYIHVLQPYHRLVVHHEQKHPQADAKGLLELELLDDGQVQQGV